MYMVVPWKKHRNRLFNHGKSVYYLKRFAFSGIFPTCTFLQKQHLYANYCCIKSQIKKWNSIYDVI